MIQFSTKRLTLSSWCTVHHLHTSMPSVTVLITVRIFLRSPIVDLQAVFERRVQSEWTVEQRDTK